jgi:thiol-disulfide isomerase/thioredoxin
VNAVPPPRPRGPLVIAVLVVFASAAGGFLLYRLGLLGREAPLALAPVHVTEGNPQPAPPHPPIPEQVPAVTLPGIDGKPLSLAQFRGRPLLINFWATWCEPCRREIPLLLRLRHERAASGLEVVGIAIDSPDAVRQYAATHGMDYPVMVGEQGGLAAVNAFGMDTVLPFSVFADQSGRIVSLKVGELHRDEAQFILDRIEAVDGGKTPLAEAQKEISEAIERLNLARSGAKPADPARNPPDPR